MEESKLERRKIARSTASKSDGQTGENESKYNSKPNRKKDRCKVCKNET